MWFKSSLTIPAVAAISFCLIGGTSTTPVYADLGDQLFKLLADDGAEDDRFSHSVSISGKLAIVGAWRDDDNGPQSGSAYLFDTATGRQIAKLLPNDGAATDFFGRSVAISGATAIVGAYSDNDNGELSGSAYLFDTTTGRQVAKLLADDGAAFDRFGRSVAISGAIAIVGAYNDDDNGSDSGSAYLFDISDPANPVQAAKLLPTDGATSDWFGFSVAISGTTALAGAYKNDDNGQSSGSAYLFDVSIPELPLQIAKLLPNDGVSGDLFGYSVAISGAISIVGAYNDAHLGVPSGSAYLFDTFTGRQITKILPNDGATDDEFGFSVGITGSPGNETVIVGAHRDDDNGSNSGSAYLFDAAALGKCPWDLDENGSAGASDLLALLASWGPCKGCPGDFDGNGAVGASDLLVLLANWGPCP